MSAAPDPGSLEQPGRGQTAEIDAAHIEHQRAWSTATFGPRELRGPTGPLAHLRKEVEEVAEDPTVLEEWVDCIILALDGAWRAGHEPQQIIDAIKAKQAKNEARSWPDWHGVPADQAIEHVRQPRTLVDRGWTHHGHAIPGRIQVGRPTAVARCGGPALCNKCAKDAALGTSKPPGQPEEP